MRSRSSAYVWACGIALAAVGLLAWQGAVAEEPAAAGKPSGVARDELVVAANPPGGGQRYARLLRQIPAPQDQKSYGDYYDYGLWSGTTYADQKDLPPGFWVYITPNWYIFGEAPGVVAADVARAPRDWGPERATGAPDTPAAGDHGTAWASRSEDD